MPHDTFPECLRPEITVLAATLYRERLARGAPGDAMADWLAAEGAVLGVHAGSPARWMPGGDLLAGAEAETAVTAGDTVPAPCAES